MFSLSFTMLCWARPENNTKTRKPHCCCGLMQLLWLNHLVVKKHVLFFCMTMCI